jgi:magnesium transporter
MLAEDDRFGLQQFCEVLNPVIVAEVLQGLDPQSVWRVLASTDIQTQAQILEMIEPSQQIELVASIDRQHLSKIIEVMAPDDRVDLLEHMDEEQLESLMPLIAQAERDEIRKLLSYPEDSAGALMTTEYASLPEEISIGEALSRLRQQAPNRETIYYVFVVDTGRRLHGVISLRELIMARPSSRLADVMKRDLVSVSVQDNQDDAAKLIARFDLIALPVLDEESRLVGIITHDDILDIVQEEANKDAYLQAGINPLEHSYFSTPLLTIASKRGVWLLFLSMMALVTASVISLLSSQTQSGQTNEPHPSDLHQQLAWFLPLVLASGGNTGSQSATLVIRAMALATMSRRDKYRLAVRELLTGLVLGLGLGLFNWIALQTLFGLSPLHAGVVSLTIVMVVTVGSVVGSILPLLFDHFGMDPAIMSNPLIASLSDLFGVFIYYKAATWVHH